jgi:5-methylcytosine-specific restriction endonuclease McrA
MNEAGSNVLTNKKSNKIKLPNQQMLQKKLLSRFWNFFTNQQEWIKGKKAKREVLKAAVEMPVLTKEERDFRLQKLKEYSELVFSIKFDKSKKRQQFNLSKHKLHNMNKSIHIKCFACLNVATCRHHIIQIQYGGYNSKNNLVSLCNDCHSEIHPWLKKQ